jgi:hypothetical protein
MQKEEATHLVVAAHSKWITYHGAGLPSKKKPPVGPLISKK